VREIFAGPSYLDVELPAGATFEQPIARGHTALLYVYRGQIDVAGKSVPTPRLAILGDGDVIRVRAPAANARFLCFPRSRWRSPRSAGDPS
jgi:redox-sensitive bicupin YhaK (pirin superfamily)